MLDQADGQTWVLTGAGISTESGLPDFRGPSGMWRNKKFSELASINAMQEDPHAFWDFYRMRLDHLSDAQPNAAHIALTHLQEAGLIKSVVTQNVDGLQQVAGSSNVLELHGSLRVARCRSCSMEVPISEVRSLWEKQPKAVPYCECSSVIGPGVVLFGEPLPIAFEQAVQLADSCQVVLVLGSSLEVFPAAQLPLITIENGGQMAIINRGTTQFDDVAAVRIDERLGLVLPALVKQLLGDSV